jgi:23S rRNA pseudouridine1911/1915/1917 synthase
MIPILFEDNHCLALDKPAGLLAQGDATGDRSVVDLASEDLKRRYSKPGNVYVGLIHRLDRPVSGVILLAKTSKAAARLSAQFHDHTVEKVYLALVEGRPVEESGEWSDVLVKDPRTNTVTVSTRDEGGSQAVVEYRVLESLAGVSLIELRPTTGRGHQLRVQLATRGLPILGDRKYGSSRTVKARDGGLRIALHALELNFNHPTRDERITVRSGRPADWPSAGLAGSWPSVDTR